VENTYITFYENEIRAVEIIIRDQNDDDFNLSTAYASVVDSDGTTVVSETECLVTDNKAYTLINMDVTSIPGSYEIIWKIVKIINSTTYHYYHKTKLIVDDL
jgi:hypothetical protein